MENRYQKLASSTEVTAAIEQIAAAITADFHDQQPLFVALLRGAAPFASKLMHAITKRDAIFHPELDYMMVSTYGSGKHAGEPRIVTDLAPSTIVTDRPVVIIDDVLDKGITADFVAAHLQKLAPRTIKLAVLCDKTTERLRDISADYVGFTFADNWLVGMGMDDAGAAPEGYRWLDEIWEIKRQQVT